MTNGDDINPEQITHILEDATLGGAEAGKQARVVSAETGSGGKLLRMRVEEEDSGLIRWDVQTEQLEALAAALSGATPGAMPFDDRIRAALEELYAEGAGSRPPVTEPEPHETAGPAPDDHEAVPQETVDWAPPAPDSYTRDTSPGPGDPDLDL